MADFQSQTEPKETNEMQPQPEIEVSGIDDTSEAQDREEMLRPEPSLTDEDITIARAEEDRHLRSVSPPPSHTGESSALPPVTGVALNQDNSSEYEYATESSKYSAHSLPEDHDQFHSPIANRPIIKTEAQKNAMPYFFCKVTFFLYLFLTCLTVSCYHGSHSWFRFLMTLNIIACITGLIGLYIMKPLWIRASRYVLILVVAIILIAVAVYIFDENGGVDAEATRRCKLDNWTTQTGNTDSFSCHRRVSKQLIWSVSGLAILYLIVSTLAIWLIRNTQRRMETQLAKPDKKRYRRRRKKKKD